MMSATKIKESRKHKRKEEPTIIRHSISEKKEDSEEYVKEKSNATKENAVASLQEEVGDRDKDEFCETALESLEITQELQNRVIQIHSEPERFTPTDRGEINVNLENSNAEQFWSYKNIQTSDMKIQNYESKLELDHSAYASIRIEKPIINYNKLLDNLKTEIETCNDVLCQPSAPLADISHHIEKSVEAYGVFQCSELCHVRSVKIGKSVKEENNIIELEMAADVESFKPFSEEELSQFYHNSELKQAQELITDFIKEEMSNRVKVLHPFYELLCSYLRAKNNFQVSRHKIKDLNENLDKYISKMWTVWNDVEVHEVGKCLDGNSVAMTKKYTQANFNKVIFEKFIIVLNEIKSTVFETFATDSFNCLKYKLKIEQYIQSLLSSCPEFSNLSGSSEISLVQPSSDSYFQQCLSNLKISIGILFLFQRKQKVEMSSSFLQESREWLNDLVSVLIRTGNLKDHLFILNHILRCPGGLGKWGSHFIQIPKSSSGRDPFSDPVLKHMMTIMMIMLQPVEKREEFMNEWNGALPDQNSWIIIDSEGEDDEAEFLPSPLKENDLVLLLNQIPLKNLFSSILGFTHDKLNQSTVNSDHLMKLFSFSSDFIKIINSGLQVYGTYRYNQFSKRLGQLLQHIIEYVTDEFDLLKTKCQSMDDSCLKRLQVEYDNFFLKSAKTIYSSRIHGTWQFLAVAPFHLVSRNTILELYSTLQLSDSQEAKGGSLKRKPLQEEARKSNIRINLTDFEEKFHQLPESEQFYLLSTFTSMVLARNLNELDFIKTVIHQLLYIGFLSNLTKDQCCKSVKSLLSSVCDKHPHLMSEILRLQNERFLWNENCDQGLSVYLWKELSIKSWKPSATDLQILSSWLLQPAQSTRSVLARLIIQSFNYGVNNGELFLPMEIHRVIAEIILKACATMPQVQEINVIRNVSTFVGLQESEQVLQVWGWNVLLKLHLHLFDQPIGKLRNSLQNLNENLQKIPVLSSLKDLHELVQQKNPIACFISLMMTSTGHSIPLIFNEGFALLEVLLQVRKSEYVIFCLENMTLMFLECPQSLYKCQQFTSVLLQLLNSDGSYLKLAKNFQSFDISDKILSSLKNMIQSQLNLCDQLCINRTAVVELWLKSLTKIQLWSEEPKVVYLLNSLCENVFFDRAGSLLVKEVLTACLLDSSPPTESKSTLASLVSWMNYKSTIPTLLPRGYNGNAVWYFLKVIEIEQELYETSNLLWNELLKELWKAKDKKTSVDNCLKKACNNLHIPGRTSEVLTIYRLCYQILETPATHPLMIILWQKFFLLYFQRVPGLMDNGSVGEKFFHGIINQNLFRRLKQRLEETFDSYNSLQKQSNNKMAEFYVKCSQALHVFQLWLEDHKMHEAHLNIHLLPPHYNVELFQSILNQDSSFWIDFIDCSELQNEKSKCILAWQELKGRTYKQELPKSPSVIQKKSLIEKIQNGLLRYENPLPPPIVNTKKYSSLVLSKDLLIHSNAMDSYLRPSFKQILDYCDFYIQEMGEYVALSCSLQELIKLLYSTKTSTLTLRSTCDGHEKVINGKKIQFKCSGPAVISLSFEESTLDVNNYDLFNQCLKNLNLCLQRSLLPLEQNLGISAVTLEKAVDELKAGYLFLKSHSEDEELLNGIKKIAVDLFYEFVLSWSTSVTLPPSLTTLFENCINTLGNTFIIDNPSECGRLLNKINEHSHLVDKLHTYFHPNATSTLDFIELYSKVKKCFPEIRVLLLSRFDMTKWLSEKRPKYSERSLLISEIGLGLKSYGSSPAEPLDLLQLLNNHLKKLLLFDFPVHYGEVLNLLLEGSESRTIPVSTWFTFLNAIVPEGIHFEQGKYDGNIFKSGQSLKKLKLYFMQYATQQRLLSLAVVRETILLLGNTFKTERLKHGLHGLYPIYRPYIEPILIYCGLMSHSYIVETLKLDLGSLSMKIADQMWPLIKELYSPWLVPYWSQQEKTQAAEWIQALTEDKCVLLPWINADISCASYSCSIFMDSIKFILDTLPGTNSILSQIWFFYVTNYAHIQVKDHVLRVIHNNLLLLPWCNFFPSLQDIELMVKVVEHFIPMAHTFLGNIYIQLKWTDIMNYYSSQNDMEALRKLHVYLLHLLVKLPCEPTLKKSDEIVVLLTEAKDYSWHLVDSNNYDCILNWFVMSCDPRIVFMDENSEYYKLDSLILQILSTCAGFTDTAREFHSTTLTKRLMFVRVNNKWLTTANSRFKCKDSAPFKSAVIRILNEIESTINVSISESQKTEEVAMLLSEFLNLFKEDDLSPVLEEVIVNWLSTKRNTTLIYGLLRSIALSAIHPETFGNIAEACLSSYFDSNEESHWSDVNSKFVTYASGQSGLQKALINNSNLLTLHAIQLKHFNSDINLLEKKIIISDIFLSLKSSKLCESIEPKLVLMIIHVCKIAEMVGLLDRAGSVSILSRLSEHLVSFINDKGNGILSTLGLRKSKSSSIKFKFMCLVASGGIMKLFKTYYTGHEDKIDEKIIRSLDQANEDKLYNSISQYVAIADEEMKKLQSLGDLINVLKNLGLQMFNKNYLK